MGNTGESLSVDIRRQMERESKFEPLVDVLTTNVYPSEDITSMS
ncbi:hypothetical protein NPIL_444971, partial [Nephila pilipes]